MGKLSQEGISLGKFRSIDERANLDILEIRGESSSPKAIEWTKENNYHWMTLPEVTTLVGYKGFLNLFDETRHYSGKYPFKKTEDVNFIFNSFLISKKNPDFKDIDIPDDIFWKPEGWFKKYICHNPNLEKENLRKKDNLYLEILDISKLDLIDISSDFRVNGDKGFGWTQKSLKEVNKDLGQKLFGKDYIRITKPLYETSEDFSSFFHGDLPRDFYQASPIDFLNTLFHLIQFLFTTEQERTKEFLR